MDGASYLFPGNPVTRYGLETIVHTRHRGIDQIFFLKGGSSGSEEESEFGESSESDEPSSQDSESEFDDDDGASDDDEDMSAGDESGDDWDALEEKALKCKF